MGSDWMSPLRRAEAYLAVRLLELERRLPTPGTPSVEPKPGTAELWRDYVDTVTAYAEVRAQLYPVTATLSTTTARRGRGARA